MRFAGATVVLTLALAFSNLALAAGAKLDLPAAKQTTLGLYMSAKEAFEAKKQNGDKVFFVDIRTPEEFEWVGYAPMVDANIPYKRTDYSAWDSNKNQYAMAGNSNFETALAEALKSRGLDKNSTIIVMCRSGDRSAAAVNTLAKVGYTKLYSVWEGFEGDMGKNGQHEGHRSVNGWKNSNLPWGYKLEKTKVYMD